ncbi:hypothetical protein B0H12DRAFT_241587 [Mycena haematopus]|nr:hypothetical protein B0H12DRAFT_241587 [Mycena haematopus]
MCQGRGRYLDIGRKANGAVSQCLISGIQLSVTFLLVVNVSSLVFFRIPYWLRPDLRVYFAQRPNHADRARLERFLEMRDEVVHLDTSLTGVLSGPCR